MLMAKPVLVSSLSATTDPRAIMAAHNNADWYAMMGDLHGCRYRRTSAAFVMRDPPPPYHSWMTTLDPDDTRAQLAIIQAHRDVPGFGLKDGFSALDLEPYGLQNRFSAQWIYADAPRAADTTGWEQITTAQDLEMWEAAWKGTPPSDIRQFPESILSRADVGIWGRRTPSGFDAGGIANLSPDCVGLSNVFGQGAFGPMAVLAHAWSDHRPMVGYERGDDLAVAVAAGCAVTGDLRVWFGA